MPKKLSKALTPLQVKNAKPGRHADGDGLHLLVKKNQGALVGLSVHAQWKGSGCWVVAVPGSD